MFDVRRPRPASVAVVLSSLFILPACGVEDGGEGWAGSVDTLASGAVEVRNPREGAWDEEDRWHLALDLRIGALESGGPDQLGSVADVVVDGAGRIYVLERQAQEVRVFDAEGSHVRTLAGPGGGPGELGNPLALEWGPGDELWVVDFGNRRYEVFDTAGARLRSHPFQGNTFGFGNRIGSDGLLYERVRIQDPERSEFGQALVRSRIPAGTPGAPEVMDTLSQPELDQGETVEVTARAGGNRMVMRFPVPLTPRSRAVLVPGRGWWLTDPGARYRLALTDFQGDTLRILGREYEPVPVTDRAREEVLDGLPDGADLNPSRIPDVHPPVAGIELAPDGGLWIRRQTAPDREGFEVFDADGRYLGEVTSEVDLDRFNLIEFGEGVMYGVLTDELDVPYVVRLRIEKP